MDRGGVVLGPGRGVEPVRASGASGRMEQRHFENGPMRASGVGCPQERGPVVMAVV